PEGLNAYTYDPAKAKQLLKDGNWDPTWKISLKYTPGDKINDAILPIVQQQFKDVGVNMELVSITAGSFNIVGDATPQKAADFDISLIGGGVFREDPNVSAKYFETTSFSPAGGNYGHYSNPQIDALLVQGRATPDRAKRKQIYTQLATILNEELPWIYLWSPNSIHGLTKRLQGFKPPSYATHIVWNAEEWYVTQ
ncbi:MAG: ABC transporter substrate-binding protein, partial [Chloroflexota bacterium]|nr:ABC transporter substrate-binding protein [Chloroflexota bacterium]